MLEHPLARGNLGCKPLQAAWADHWKSAAFNFGPQFCKNMVSDPPPHPYISETAFCHRFQKVYTYPPLTKGRNFGALDQKFRNPTKSTKTHLVGAF